MVDFIVFIGIGIVAGFFAGLLGLGGGIITTPAMFFVFTKLQKQSAHAMHIAIATTLACMIFTSLSSCYFHHKKKAIEWPTVRNMLIGVIFGSFLGTFVSKILPSDILKIIFGIFLLALGIRFFFEKKKKNPSSDYQKPNYWIVSSVGLVTSFISSLLGIGGGLFSVPTFLTFKMHMRNAIATSSAISLFVSVLATFWFIVFGLFNKVSGASLGYINVKAFFVITICSVCIAPLGVKMAHVINTKLLKKIFGSLIILIGIYMVIR